MRLIALTIFISFLASPLLLRAQECAYRDGGYCVSAIADQAAKKLKKEVTTETATEGTAYLTYYEKLWNQMVREGNATTKERESAFKEASRAGGTKIGGVNLVVLGARTLQKLVDLQLLTLEEAQGILDQSKDPVKGKIHGD